MISRNEDDLLPFLDRALSPPGTNSAAIHEEITLVLEDTEEPQGPWSPNPVIDRYLAPIRQRLLQKSREEFLRQTVEEYRKQHPPWWTRLKSRFRRWRQRYDRKGTDDIDLTRTSRNHTGFPKSSRDSKRPFYP